MAENRDRACLVEILSIKAYQNAVVRFLGDYRGTLIHWDGKRSHHCVGQPECPRSLHEKRTLWKGYAPVELWDKAQELWLPFVLELTENLEEQLRGQPLRGQCYLLIRAEKKDKTGAVGAVYCQTFENVPRAFPIEPVLLRCFRVETLCLDVPNTLPQRVSASPSTGDAPQLPKTFQATEPPVNEKAAETFRQRLDKKFGRKEPSRNGDEH